MEPSKESLVLVGKKVLIPRWESGYFSILRINSVKMLEDYREPGGSFFEAFFMETIQPDIEALEGFYERFDFYTLEDIANMFGD